MEKLECHKIFHVFVNLLKLSIQLIFNALHNWRKGTVTLYLFLVLRNFHREIGSQTLFLVFQNQYRKV